MPDELLGTVAELYEAHRQAAFPRRLAVEDANGVEMAGLCSRVSGCIHSWLGNGGRADDRLGRTLAICEQQLNRAIPALDGDEASYFQLLLDMTVLILENLRDMQPE